MASVVISIVTWNSRNTIGDCIRSILNQNFKDYFIIVVDNNSNDSTVEIVNGFEDPKIKLIRLDSNTGYCRGNNYAIRRLESEYILIANPDVVFTQDYISNAVKAFKHDKRIGIVCGVLLQGYPSKEDPLIDAAGLMITRSRRFRLICHGRTIDELPQSDFEVFGSDGAAPMYKRKMIKELSFNGQFFDEAFFAHKEDHDISWRAQLKGWRTICARGAIAYHPRKFKPGNLKVRKSIPSEVKFHAVKNQFLLQLKNELFLNFILDAPWIIGRQLGVFLYIVLLERSSLGAYLYLFKHLRSILKKRKLVQQQRAVTWSNIRSWLGRQWKMLD